MADLRSGSRRQYPLSGLHHPLLSEQASILESSSTRWGDVRPLLAVRLIVSAGMHLTNRIDGYGDVAKIVNDGSIERQIRSRQRVADHGEVFTPSWMVEEMLNLVKDESERIESRFLEPACGSGNFLVPVLHRKLSAVQARHRKSDFEKRHYALLALMCVYGIELLADNAQECRAALLAAFTQYLGKECGEEWSRAARAVLNANIVLGDALTMTTADGKPITFPEWAYLGKGKYQRRDFRYDALVQRASFEGTLWDHLEEHEVFTPTKSYPTMTVKEIAL